MIIQRYWPPRGEVTFTHLWQALITLQPHKTFYRLTFIILTIMVIHFAVTCLLSFRDRLARPTKWVAYKNNFTLRATHRNQRKRQLMMIMMDYQYWLWVDTSVNKCERNIFDIIVLFPFESTKPRVVSSKLPPSSYLRKKYFIFIKCSENFFPFDAKTSNSIPLFNFRKVETAFAPQHPLPVELITSLF